MSDAKLIVSYSWRIVRRQWRRFVLPLGSLTVTSIVLLLILLLTGSSAALLVDQARTLQGGDVVLESANPIDGAEFFAQTNISPTAVTQKSTFSATVQSASATAPISINVIDEVYPIYGEIKLENAAFSPLQPGEIIIDAAGLAALEINVGDEVVLGAVTLTVIDVLTSEPTSLFGGFQFLPVAFINPSSFTAADIDPSLLRIEYSYAVQTGELTTAAVESIQLAAEQYPLYDVDIAGVDSGGLQFGLQTVSDFLIIAVLITAVLAAVNVYASILYLVTIERKSLAVLLALGLSKPSLVGVLGMSLVYIVAVASIIGSTIAVGGFMIAQWFIAGSFSIDLPTPMISTYILATVGLIALIALMSFIPAMYRSLALNPKQILIGDDSVVTFGGSYKSVIVITGLTLVPLIALSVILLDSLVRGVLVVGAIALVYLVISGVYTLVLSQLYKFRHKFSFLTRSVISQKHTDGLFGVVSFTSLFVALAALCVLVLVQTSLERFLNDDLSATVPSTYVLDVQPSQRTELLAQFPDLELFSNTGARIIAIDGVQIQDEIAANTGAVSRELGREFNLTDRNDLLASETIVAGTWANGAPGEVSVDSDFAEQANIALGSGVTFLVQGFEVSATVTSLRETDSTSGLPFFYFVLSPQDLEQFPSVYFGYGFLTPQTQTELGQYLANNTPNVSLIETQALQPLLEQLIGTLLILILIVTAPPLLIATLLIAMLVISLYSTRKREGARFRALGMTEQRTFQQYMIETLSVTIVAAILAYGFGALTAYYIGVNFLALDTTAWFDVELLLAFGLVIAFVIGIALYMYKTDTMSLRALLSYE